MKNHYSFKLIILTFIYFVVGCSSASYDRIYPTLNDGKYDSEFPYRSTSSELQKISETIHRITSTAFYKVYLFSEEQKVTIETLKEKDIEKVALKKLLADNSSSGTGVTVFSENGIVALLTCAHNVTFQDTIPAYFVDESGNKSDYLESISILEKQIVYAAGFPEGSQIEILLKDDKIDIAILGRRYGAGSGISFPVFRYPTGKAKELEWGTFVYVIGYPINYKMITKAIVSNPNKDESGSFFIDADINPGFSGGLVLAIRDGVPNFELIGIVQWVPEEEFNIVVPEQLPGAQIYNPLIPYKGNFFIKKYSSVKYGIAKVIPIEIIIDYLKNNAEFLSKKGYYIFSQQ